VLANLLPVYGPNHRYIQHVTVNRAQELLDEGRAIPKGTKTRIHALLVPRGSEEFLRDDRPARVPKDIYDYENDENPRGVWTFKFRKLRQYEEAYAEMRTNAA